MKKISEFLNSRQWMTSAWAINLVAIVIDMTMLGMTREPQWAVYGALSGASSLYFAYRLDMTEDK